ncbi:GntR family transcriptional regulator [Bordetella avium]|uniref:GntR family transcriptional regulator n=1 Tax=Bordetella avium TaxID=521 RepID=UPI003BAA5F25
MRVLCSNARPAILLLFFFMPLDDFHLQAKAPATIPYFLKEQVRELIIDGRFRPGQPLREQELEQRFGTSRSPIREALRLLELTGLVVHVQRKGFRVRRYSEVEIRQIYALRAELAAYSLLQLANLNFDKLLESMRAYDRVLARAHLDQDVRAYAGNLRDFHLLAARFTANTPLEDALSRLYEQVEPTRHIYLRHAMSQLPYDAFHAKVLHAITDGDLPRAAAMTRSDVLATVVNIVQVYEMAAGDGLS